MRVALIGSVSSSWHTLRGLGESGVDIACVLGLDIRHAERVSDFRDLRPLAEKFGVPFRSFDKIAEPGVVELLGEQRPDLLFVVGLSQLVPQSVLDLARSGAIGFHPTPLPKGRGRAPVFWTIYLEQPAAANLFWLTEQADAGDIVIQKPVEVRPDDYAQDLIDRTNEVLEQAVRELAPAIKSGNLPRTPQDHAQATWYGRRGPEDGRIDWSRPADELYRLIRAASRPYPGAFTSDRGNRLVVWRAALHDRDDHVGTVGQVVRVDAARGALVQCGRGHLWITEAEDAVGQPIAPCKLRVGHALGDDRGEIEALRGRIEALEAKLDTREQEGKA